MTIPQETFREYGCEYVLQDIITQEYVLLVDIGDRQFELPRMNVGTEKKPVSIFKVDLRSGINPELFEAAASWYADQFVQDDISTLVIPHSTKSTECLFRAVEIANEQKRDSGSAEIRIIQLVGGTAESDVQGCTFTQVYDPITVKPGEHKYMGILDEDVGFLQSLFVSNGEEILYDRQRVETIKGIAIADDVLSSGNTLNAIDNLLNDVTNGSLFNARVYVLAREEEEPFKPLDARTTAAIYIPVIIGELPKSV